MTLQRVLALGPSYRGGKFRLLSTPRTVGVSVAPEQIKTRLRRSERPRKEERTQWDALCRQGCQKDALRYTRSMIRLGNLTRFTPHEVDEFRQVGLDMGNVTHQKDIEQEVSRWAHILADERFDLLEKIASAMAKSRGVKMPPNDNQISNLPTALILNESDRGQAKHRHALT